MIQNDAQTRSYLNWSANHQKRPGRTMGRQMNGLFAKSNASSSNKPHRPHLSYLSGCQWHGGVKLYYEIQGPLRREFQGARARAWGEGEVPRGVIVCFVCSFHIISLYFSWFDLIFLVYVYFLFLYMSFAFVLLIFWRFTLFHFSSLTYCVYCCLRSCVVLYTSLIFCLFILLVVNRFELCLSICCFILSYHCFVECFSLHL